MALDLATKRLSQEVEQLLIVTEPSSEQHFLPPIMSTLQNPPQVGQVKDPSSEQNFPPSLVSTEQDFEKYLPPNTNIRFVSNMDSIVQHVPNDQTTHVEESLSMAGSSQSTIIRADVLLVSESVRDEIVTETVVKVQPLKRLSTKFRKTDSEISSAASSDRITPGYCSEPQADASKPGCSNIVNPGAVNFTREKFKLNLPVEMESPAGSFTGTSKPVVISVTQHDPFTFNEIEESDIQNYRPLKRKLAEITVQSSGSLRSNKKLKSIFEDIFDSKESSSFLADKNFTNEENDKLKTIFDDILSESATLKISENNRSEIFLVHCLECNFSTTSILDFYDTKFHSCILDCDAMKCETCAEMANDAKSLSLHVDQHKSPVTFLQPLKVRLGNVSCSTECLSKSCCKIPISKITSIQKELKTMGKVELHNFLLSRLKVQKTLGLDSHHSFVFKSEVFCHSSAILYLNLSRYLVTQVVKEHLSGQVKFSHGNLGNFYLSEKRDKAVSFILQFVRTHCENLPDKEVMRLPSYMNVKEIFRNYTESVSKNSHLKERSFCHVFKTYFGDVARAPIGLPRVTFMPRHSHPVCSECDNINLLRKVATNESETIYANERKKKHMLEIQEKFVQFCDRKELSVRFPEDYLHINLDDIDQSKMKTPYAVQKTKDCVGMLKLDNHCTGVIVTNGKFDGDRCVLAYLNNNQYAQDSNKTVSILFDVLLFVKEKLGNLPRKLLVQSDNCSRELKNQFVLGFYWVLVEIGVFEEVVVSHMPVGHTHGDVDQIFSIFASRLRNLELPTFEMLLSELRKISINSQPIIVKEMLYTTDFVQHITKHLQPMSGHTSFFQFKIRKENKITKMFVKQDVLEKVWQFTTGIWLFEPSPSMKNLLVSQFRSESDYGEIFSSVWKKYIPTLELKYSWEEVNQIKDKWERRISFLINLKESQFQAFDVFKLLPKGQKVKEVSTTFKSRVDQIGASKEVALTATFYPPEIKTFSVQDLFIDCSVVFYTRTKTTRPWIGIFIELIEDGNSVKIKVEWLKKEKKYFVLDCNSNGSPFYSVLNIDSVMFSNILRNCSYTGNRKGPYIMDVETKKEISKAYEERDDNLIFE